MKKRLEEFTCQLSELTTMTKKEYLLTLAVCVLGGIIVGFLSAPIKKGKYVKVQCGNNNGNDYRECGCPEEEEK